MGDDLSATWDIHEFWPFFTNPRPAPAPVVSTFCIVACTRTEDARGNWTASRDPIDRASDLMRCDIGRDIVPIADNCRLDRGHLTREITVESLKGSYRI